MQGFPRMHGKPCLPMDISVSIGDQLLPGTGVGSVRSRTFTKEE